MEKEDRISEILENPAELEDAERVQCDNCEERVVFHLRDSEGHDFGVGLTTMLKCIEFAVVQGELPKLPMRWCADVSLAYGIEFSQDFMVWNDEK